MGITFEPKGGNSPVRFYLILNGEKIAEATRANKRGFTKDLWRVRVFNSKFTNEISEYMFNVKKVERFYWG